MHEAKNIFVILGMARSGTSVIARGLKALGIDFGDQFTTAKTNWNPTGSSEDAGIFDINRKVLRLINNSDKNLAIQETKIWQTLQEKGYTLLQQRMLHTAYWGFKDPQATQVLMFWQPIFHSLKLNEHYIIAARNPLASAHSFQRVSGKPIEVGLLSWIMHVTAAIDGTMNKKNLLVNYELMLKSPQQELERIKKYFNIPTLNQCADIDAFTHHYLDKKLHHYEYTFEDLKQHRFARALPLCIKMYTLFMQLAKDEVTFESEVFITHWKDIKNELETSLPLYQHIERLLHQNYLLEKSIRTIKKSLPWKLTYPLRLIDDQLRTYRRKKRLRSV